LLGVQVHRAQRTNRDRTTSCLDRVSIPC
jgi:hypothetical protein